VTPDGRLLAACVRRAEAARASPLARQNLTWCPDEELVYERFNDDFGPLDLGQTWHFCERVSMLLARAARASPNRRVFLFSRSDPQSRANFAVLVGAYLILCCGAAADSTFSQVQPLQPFAPFRDAASTPSLFKLSVLDCLRGLQRGRDVGHLEGFAASITARVDGDREDLLREKRETSASVSGGVGKCAETAPLAPTKVLAQGHGPARHSFDVKEYEKWARLENGDMHWIIPRQFVAFSGPQNRRTAGLAGFGLTPEDYLNYFGRHRVRAVVRLNAKAYEASRFESRGIRVHELFFQDGSCPPPKIVRRFLQVAEAEEGALAVHCKAGLGRTGVLISLYNMKHFSFTAREALGYIRLCRPGSVIGPQQNFLCDMESRMWAEGRAWRAQNLPARSALGKTTVSTPVERELLPSTENSSEGRCPVSAYALAGRPGRQIDRAASTLPPSLSSLTILQSQAGSPSPSPRKTANSSLSPSPSPRRGAAFLNRAAAPSLLSRVASETPTSPNPRKKAAAVHHQLQQRPQLPPHSKMSQYLETSHAMGAAFHKVT